MTKVLYPVKIQFLPFICEDITVVMTNSVSTNRKLPSQHRAITFFIHKSVVLKNRMEFSNQLLNLDIIILRRRAKRKDYWKVVQMTDSEVDNLIETEENSNTERKKQYDINFVKQFLTEHGERRSIEETPAVELNNYVSKFIFAARTKKDEEYEPSSLRGILSSVERHQRRPGYGKSIIKDNDFQKAREPLNQNRKN